MLALLTLLLLFNGRNSDGHGTRARLNIEQAEILVLLKASEAIAKGGLAQQQICLREILSGKGADYALNRGQALVDLLLILADDHVHRMSC